MVGPVCRRREILRNCGYVLRAVFPTEVFGAGIYSSVIFRRSMVLANAVERTGEAFDALPNVTAGERIQFAVHHQALVNMMAARVVGRDHPEAWGRGEPPKGAGFDPLKPDT